VKKPVIDFKSSEERALWDSLVRAGRSVYAMTNMKFADEIILGRRKRSERMELLRNLDGPLLVKFALNCAADENEHVIHSWPSGSIQNASPTVCGRNPISRIPINNADLSYRSMRTFTVDGHPHVFDLCPYCVAVIRG